MKELKTDNNINKQKDINENENIKDMNISSKFRKTKEKKIKRNQNNSRKKNNSPKYSSKHSVILRLFVLFQCGTFTDVAL